MKEQTHLRRLVRQKISDAKEIAVFKRNHQRNQERVAKALAAQAARDKEEAATQRLRRASDAFLPERSLVGSITSRAEKETQEERRTSDGSRISTGSGAQRGQRQPTSQPKRKSPGRNASVSLVDLHADLPPVPQGTDIDEGDGGPLQILELSDEEDAGEDNRARKEIQRSEKPYFSVGDIDTLMQAVQEQPQGNIEMAILKNQRLMSLAFSDLKKEIVARNRVSIHCNYEH